MRKRVTRNRPEPPATKAARRSTRPRAACTRRPRLRKAGPPAAAMSVAPRSRMPCRDARSSPCRAVRRRCWRISSGARPARPRRRCAGPRPHRGRGRTPPRCRGSRVRVRAFDEMARHAEIGFSDPRGARRSQREEFILPRAPRGVTERTLRATMPPCPQGRASARPARRQAGWRQEPTADQVRGREVSTELSEEQSFIHHHGVHALPLERRGPRRQRRRADQRVGKRARVEEGRCGLLRAPGVEGRDGDIRAGTCPRVRVNLPQQRQGTVHAPAGPPHHG